MEFCGSFLLLPRISTGKRNLFSTSLQGYILFFVVPPGRIFSSHVAGSSLKQNFHAPSPSEYQMVYVKAAESQGRPWGE